MKHIVKFTESERGCGGEVWYNPYSSEEEARKEVKESMVAFVEVCSDNLLLVKEDGAIRRVRAEDGIIRLKDVYKLSGAVFGMVKVDATAKIEADAVIYLLSQMRVQIPVVEKSTKKSKLDITKVLNKDWNNGYLK